MRQTLHAVTVLVPNYDAAIEFYVGVMGFTLAENVELSGGKRWVRVVPPGSEVGGLILAKATTEMQQAAIGQQSGDRVGFFLSTDNFSRDHARMLDNGVLFEEAPRKEPYGTVAVWRDPFGNRWDLIEFSTS